MEIRQHWQVLWKRRWWMVTVFTLVFLATGYWTFTTTPLYESSAKVMLIAKDRTLSSFGRDMEDLGKLSATSLHSSPLETQAEVLRSAPVLSQVIERTTLIDPATGSLLSPDKFRLSSRVLWVKDTDILEISYAHPDPARAQEIVDTWARVFMEDNQAANREQAALSAKFLKGQMDKAKNDLSQAESALRDFRQANIAIDLPEQARSTIQSLSDLDAQIRQATAAQVEASSRVTALRAQIGLSSTQALAATALSQDPNIQRLRGQLVDAETGMSGAGLAASHPDFKRREAQVAELRQQLAKQAANLVGRHYSGITTTLDPVRQALTTDLVQAEISALGYATRLETLRALAGAYNGRLSGMPTKQLALTRLDRRTSSASELYRMLSQKYHEAKIQAEVSQGNIRLIEGADLPLAPFKPKTLLNMGIAGLVGLALGLGAVLLREHLEDTIQTVDGAEKALALPLLGVIPWQRRRTMSRLITLREPRAPVSEAYRSLRTNLKFLTADSLRTITLTSAGAGEGKSTTIANLAVTFAQGARRVLLVDADMRKPTQHEIFELPNDVGLSTLLTGATRIEDAIQHTSLTTLDVMTCGPLPPDPAELLDSPQMAAVLAELRKRYDLVLFDAPPIIAVADASILGAQLDGLIVLLGLNRVSRRAAKHALQRLQATQIRVWGMIASGMRSDHDPYYHAYYATYYGEVAQRRGFGRLAGLWRRKAG